MSTFKTLSQIDVSDYTEKKGGLTYLSWAQAWREFKTQCPCATYEVKHFDGKPYHADDQLGYIVETSVTVDGETHMMWLPVLDYRNKALPVGKATMFDINTAIMRCLTKNLAMFGLGIYIYAGEDLPIAERMTAEEAIAIIEKAKDMEELRKSFLDLPASLKQNTLVISAKDKAKEIFDNN
jgi:hypothetical protein